MKKIVLIFMIMAVAAPCFAFVESYGPEYNAVVTIFQGDEEPQAMDAFWKTESLLKIGVFKHGEDYNKYASHACEVVQAHGFEGQGVAIEIIDLKQLAEAEKWVALGQAQCR